MAKNGVQYGKIPRKNYKQKYNKAKYQRKYRKRKALNGEKISCSSERLTYMVNRQLPFPPKYRTKMTFNVYGYMDAPDLNPNGTGHCWVSLNSLNGPIANTSWDLVTGTGPFTIVSTFGSNTALKPAGFSQICNAQLYQAYRVYSSSLSFSLTPSTAVDYIELSVTPSDTTSNPSTTATAISQPYTKSHVMLTGKGPYRVKNYMSSHRLLGVNKQAIENDLSGNLFGTFASSPSTPQYWVINVQTNHEDEATTDMAFEMKVTYWVEFFDLATAELAIT